MNPDIARDQKAHQDELNRILNNALTGQFKVIIDRERRTNPKATDLRRGAYYTLVTSTKKDYMYYFQQGYQPGSQTTININDQANIDHPGPEGGDNWQHEGQSLPRPGGGGHFYICDNLN